MAEAHQELFRRIRQIEIRTRRLVQEQFAGGYHSVFKGRGIEFAASREYVPGDDVRLIDWNATARFDRPYVKLYTEERELTVMLLVDVSASMYFGTAGRLKRQLATEFCATIAFSAITNNDRVGMILFTDHVERIVPPKKGRKHILRLIHELLLFEPSRRETNLALALDRASRLMRHSGTMFIVSDFLAAEYERALLMAGKRHDCIAVTILDRSETAPAPPRRRRRPEPEPAVTTDLLRGTLPDEGIYALEDPETGAVRLVDLGHRRTRQALLEIRAELAQQRRRTLQRAEVEEIQLVTDQSFVEPLIAFFGRRTRHLRQGV